MASGALSELFRQLKWMFVKNGPGFTGTHHSVELTKLCAVMKEDTPPKSILDFFGSPLKEQELFDAENNADELYALCDDPMQIPVKLVDDQLRFTDLTDIQDLFVENTGFLVVGVIGLQGSGKSSLLNILANQLPNDASLLDGPFAVQSIKNILTNSPETGGIDLYITQDRIILLDTQPLLSFSLTNYHSQNASSVSGAQMDIAPATPGSNSTVSTLTGPGNWSLDVWAELSSIQVVAFLLNVCHVVVVVNNDLSSKSMQLYRLIDRAAGLKPTVYTLSVMPNLIDIRRHSRESRLLKMENRRELRPGGLNKVSCMNAVRSEEPCRNDDSSSDSDQEDLGGIQNANKAADRGIPDMQDVLVTPSGLLHPRQHRQQHRQCSIEADSADVTDALNRLKGLTDYSASLVHVYNQAPAAAFLDPLILRRLDRYRDQLLPLLFSEYRRLAALVSVGPQILSTHLATRFRNHAATAPISDGDAAVEVDASSSVPPKPAATIASAVTAAVAVDVAENSVVGELHMSPAFLYSSIRSDDVTKDAVQHTALALSDSQMESRGSTGPSEKEEEEDERKSSVKSEDAHLPQPEDSESAGMHTSSVTGHPESQAEHSSGVEKVSRVSSPETNVTTDATSDSVGLQKYSVRKSAESSNKSEKEISPQLEVGPQPALSANSATHQSGPSEAEIVTECCSVLEAVESELCDMLRSLPHPNARTSKSPQILDSESASDEDDSNVENGVLDGEKLNAKLTKMTHYVQSIRRRFFDLQERLNRPRLFLVPEVDDEANTPVGCPTYADSVRLLQEAIISTPRQHMMPNFTEKKWIAYAQKMWDAVCSSPLLLDYHSVLINQL